MRDIEHQKRNRILFALIPLGVIALVVGSMLLIYTLASNSNAGEDPSPGPLPFIPIAAVLIAVGVGTVLWALLSRRGDR